MPIYHNFDPFGWLGWFKHFYCESPPSNWRGGGPRGVMEED